MFNFSGSELVFLLLLALIILGPEKLPEAIRKFGQTYAEFKKVTTGFQTELKQALDEPVREMRQTAELFKQAATFDGLDGPQTVVPAPQQPARTDGADDSTAAGAAPPLAAAAAAAGADAASRDAADKDADVAVAAGEKSKQITGETVQRMRSLDDVIVRQPFGQAMTTPVAATAPEASPANADTSEPPGADGPGAHEAGAASGETAATTEPPSPDDAPPTVDGEGTTPA